MPRSDPELQDTLELLEPLGPVQARAMFGGWGLFLGGTMFGLMLQRRLYLKTDDTTRAAFEAAGGEPFAYEAGKRGRTIITSYWTPPSDASDDTHALLPWARRALEAAQRTALKKKPSVKKSVKKSARRA